MPDYSMDGEVWEWFGSTTLDFFKVYGLQFTHGGEILDQTSLDRIEEDTFNRIIWHSVKGYDVPYPVR